MTRGSTFAVAAGMALLLVHLSAQAPSTGLKRIVKIVGDTHKLLLRTDGSVAGWGQARNGQLGPVEAITIDGNGESTHLVAIDLPARAVDVAAGAKTSYALLDDGTVMAWGAGDQGQLGTGVVTLPLLATSTSSFSYRGMAKPVRVAGVDEAVAVAAFGPSAYALLRDGRVMAWGAENIGDDRAPKSYSGPSTARGPAFTAVVVPELADISNISAGGGHVLALAKNGHVFSWGSNFYGALGRPPRQELPIDVVGEVVGLANVAQVVAGSGVSTALKNDGTVWVWGSNWQQQFGFPAPTNQPNPTSGWVLEPQQVPGLTTVSAIAVGASGRHTLALLKDGTLRAWGNTDWGQAGSGMGPGYHARPVIPKITGVTAIFAVGNNSFAIRSDGSLWAWGNGGSGRFPLTSNVRVPTPAPPGLQ